MIAQKLNHRHSFDSSWLSPTPQLRNALASYSYIPERRITATHKSDTEQLALGDQPSIRSLVERLHQSATFHRFSHDGISPGSQTRRTSKGSTMLSRSIQYAPYTWLLGSSQSRGVHQHDQRSINLRWNDGPAKYCNRKLQFMLYIVYMVIPTHQTDSSSRTYSRVLAPNVSVSPDLSW